MAKTIAIVNQKGGVGKTTTCVNLAAALTEAGQRILLCDFDPQANSTSGMGVDKTVSKGIYDALIGEVPVEDALVHTKYGDVLPSNKALAGATIEMIALEQPVSDTAALNPDWVEWLMGFPRKWTDVSSGPLSRRESPVSPRTPQTAPSD